MKILLVQPNMIDAQQKGVYDRNNSYTAIALPLLAALVPPSLHADIRLHNEMNDKRPLDYDVDIIGISVYTASAKRAYAIAQEARARGVYVVLGGYHVSLNPDEARPYADTLFIGQADQTWPQFLLDFQQGMAHAEYREVGTLDLHGSPPLRRDLLNKRLTYPADVIQASRGCPNGCEFCAVSYYLGTRVLQRPVHEVIDEVRTLPFKTLLFLDPNFTADLEYAKELMTALKPLKKSWTCLTTVDTARNDETLQLMRDSGCIGVLVGLETVCATTLQRIHKGFNRVSRYREQVARFHQYQLGVLGCFVLGFDEDTTAVFQETLEFIDGSDLDIVRFSLLTPFPGTPLFRRMEAEGRILTSDWDLYDQEHVVFQPKLMTPRELQEGYYWMWREAYRFRRILRRVSNSPRRHLLSLSANVIFSHWARRMTRLTRIQHSLATLAYQGEQR